MDELEAALAAYYDAEGAARESMPLGDGRLAGRTAFIELLRREGRHTLLEVGSGPGRDALAFASAGFDVTAIDRSGGHIRLAAAAGLRAVHASLLAVPFPPATFDAGWTMSTLVHVPDERWDTAMTSITSALRPGAPLAVGLWGGVDVEHWQPARDRLPTRFFSRPSHDRARRLLERFGTLESFETWGDHRSDWEYQLAVLRLPA